ncbi:glycerophosphoryl diester phosphodiesterase [Fontibacillus phaseoli]|uniref:Glycerophosphoryl diester phosphodiesterase n=1 Tax=Fontibacillus phaseoli TaxID=1416533 RepID=A0A369BTD7_9BACL|nr:glycerophosphodiester phosphodiesterase [Fontibacillus phaseoli]RCX23677.1 glycerophosphoryl diester phosphodiesterase [Fontibacillus phaseoli]
MQYPKLIAHTGCEGTSYNSLESCEAGMKAGAPILEVDVRATKDQVAVLQHDEEPYVNKLSYEQLLETGHNPETLNRVLTRFSQLPVAFNLDLKTEEAAVAAIADITATSTWSQVWFTGDTRLIENSQYSRHVMRNLPKQFCELDEASYRQQVAELCRRAAETKLGGVNLHYESCRPYLVQQAHHHGLQVWIYTLPDDPDLFFKYMDMGVDAISVYEVRKFAVLLAVMSEDGGE